MLAVTWAHAEILLLATEQTPDASPPFPTALVRWKLLPVLETNTRSNKKDALIQSVQVQKTCQGTGFSSMDELRSILSSK